MRHTRDEVIQRTIDEFNCLDQLISHLTVEEWNTLVPRPDEKDAWTVKDTVAHITHWKADTIRKIKRLPVPAEEKGLNWTDGNRVIYERWRDRSASDVFAWHRQVQADVIAELQSAPEKWFSGREHRPEWPNDLDGHSRYHRVNDIKPALGKSNA
jgi:hypothetical protein